MTSEEAKEVFLNRGFIDGIYDGDKWREACIVISKWLEQEPTTKNNLGVDCVSRADARKAIIDHQYSDSFCEEHNIDHSINTGMALIALSDLPSVTPQLSSGLEKNSQKLEKNFGELDCISRADAIKAMQDKAKKITNEDTINGLCGAVAILFDMPSVTPQEPKWIPVSERLPEMAFGCFVTVEEDDRNGEPQSVLYPEFVGYDGETWNNADGEPIPFEVIAWMPLPPCYEPQEREAEDGNDK